MPNQPKTPTDVTEHGTLRMGHPSVYGSRIPTVTVVSVGGETFFRQGDTYLTPCGHCDSKHPGGKAHYGHRFDGVCFQCRGHGYRKVVEGGLDAVTKIVKRRIADRARAARKATERAEAQAQAAAQWATDHPELDAELAAVRTDAGDPNSDNYWDTLSAAQDKWTPFVVEIARFAEHAALTDNQTTAVTEAIANATTAYAAAQAKAAAARYEGAVGDKVTGTGTIVTAITVGEYSPYGSSRLVVVEGTADHAGVTFKMFGTGKTLWDTERGQTVTVTGTVKAHEDYQGTKQTVLTRTKVEDPA